MGKMKEDVFVTMKDVIAREGNTMVVIVIQHNMKEGRDESICTYRTGFKDRQVCASLHNNVLTVKLMWIITEAIF